MSRSYPQFHLRISPALDELVRISANQKGLSVNAELLRRIQLSFDLENLLEGMPGEFESLHVKIDRLLNAIDTTPHSESETDPLK